MTRTLDRRPEIGLDSFDRFFPNQDTLPKGGFGNRIALPLQKAARGKNHSLFLDDNLVPYPDQWAYLASIKRIGEEQLDAIIQIDAEQRELLSVSWQWGLPLKPIPHHRLNRTVFNDTSMFYLINNFEKNPTAQPNSIVVTIIIGRPFGSSLYIKNAIGKTNKIDTIIPFKKEIDTKFINDGIC
jgi:hypothetical protein